MYTILARRVSRLVHVANLIDATKSRKL